MMQKMAAFGSLMLLLSCAAFGQSGDGYVFFAPGQVRVSTQGLGDSKFEMHFGGGGRYFSSSGAGFGVEMGIAGPKENFGDEYVGTFSPNAYYQFNTSNEKMKPFLTGGYTRAFGRDSGVNFGNYGVGLTYWSTDRLGLLTEFRHHIGSKEGVRLQLWTIRFGLAFK